MKRREGNEFWKGHLEGWRGSGMTQEAYCRQQGLSFTTFARNRNRINRQHKASAGVNHESVTFAALVSINEVPPQFLAQVWERRAPHPLRDARPRARRSTARVCPAPRNESATRISKCRCLL